MGPLELQRKILYQVSKIITIFQKEKMYPSIMQLQTGKYPMKARNDTWNSSGRISIEVLGLSFMSTLWLIFEEIGLCAQLNDMFTLIVLQCLQSFLPYSPVFFSFLSKDEKESLCLRLEFTSGLILSRCHRKGL